MGFEWDRLNLWQFEAENRSFNPKTKVPLCLVRNNTDPPSFSPQHPPTRGIFFVPQELCADSCNMWAPVRETVIPVLKRKVRMKKVMHKLHKLSFALHRLTLSKSLVPSSF